MLYFGNFNDPFKCFWITIHSNFDPFWVLHLFNHFTKVWNGFTFLDPLSRQKNFFYTTVLSIFVTQKYFDEIKVKWFLLLLGHWFWRLLSNWWFTWKRSREQLHGLTSTLTTLRWSKRWQAWFWALWNGWWDQWKLNTWIRTLFSFEWAICTNISRLNVSLSLNLGG